MPTKCPSPPFLCAQKQPHLQCLWDLDYKPHSLDQQWASATYNQTNDRPKMWRPKEGSIDSDKKIFSPPFFKGTAWVQPSSFSIPVFLLLQTMHWYIRLSRHFTYCIASVRLWNLQSLQFRGGKKQYLYLMIRKAPFNINYLTKQQLTNHINDIAKTNLYDWIIFLTFKALGLKFHFNLSTCAIGSKTRTLEVKLGTSKLHFVR